MSKAHYFRDIFRQDRNQRIKEQGGTVGFRNGNGPTVD